VHRRSVGNLERSPAAGTKHAADLGDVPERDLRVRDVLEDHIGVTNIGARALDPGEAAPVTFDPHDVDEVPVVFARDREHLGRDVDRPHGRRALGQGARHPSDPAADLNHVVGRRDRCTKVAKEEVDTLAAARPEALQVGPSVLEPVVDEEVRVLTRTGVPVVAHGVRGHGPDATASVG
jgi:hypothetical protein